MNETGNDIEGMGRERAVIAIAQEENELRAVRIGKQQSGFEVLWTRSSDVKKMSWQRFAAECGLSAEQTGQKDRAGDGAIVTGFDSAAVAFYRIELPAVGQEEIAAMVRLQAEARLPLPAEQIELAWRTAPISNGQMAVTIAAAKREQLQQFVEDVRELKPANILLDGEAIVEIWREVFRGSDKPSVVISMGSCGTLVCLAERGRLSNAVNLDVGTEDFSAVQGNRAEEIQIAERFAQDTRNVLELFGYGEPGELPVFVLSDGRSSIEAVAEQLVSAGLNAQIALPDEERLRTRAQGGAEELYEYRVPIGLALMELSGDAEALNIFESLYSPAEKGQKKYWLYSLKVTSALAAAMLAVLVVVFYAIDVLSEGHLTRLRQQTNLAVHIQRQKLVKAVASQRPDILELLKKMNDCESKGITLDSLDFKKGREVSITGQAQKAEQLYKFQKSLLGQKGISEVNIRSSGKGKKDEKLKFTIAFHYRNFTRKTGRVSAQRERLGRL